MIRVCAELGVTAVRVEGRSGVWVRADESGPDRKIGDIGIRASQNVAMHGFALSCCCDLSWAHVIAPCGIPDAGVTSLSKKLGREVPVQEVLFYAERHLSDILG